MYLAVSLLSCITWDLSFQLLDSPVAAPRLSFPVTGGFLAPQAGIELVLPALQTRILTTLPLGKTPSLCSSLNL